MIETAEIAALLESIMEHFKAINEKTGLTDEDRTCLKEYYLQSVAVPRARKLLRVTGSKANNGDAIAVESQSAGEQTVAT